MENAHDEQSTATELAEWVLDAHRVTLDLIADLDGERLMGPRLKIINPALWEIGHTAWFQEKWVLRHLCGHKPIRDDADSLYDSIAIPHRVRWDLPLPKLEDTLDYVREVRERVIDVLHQGPLSADLAYHVRYTVFHDDMHCEALTYTRQTLGYPAPQLMGHGTTHCSAAGGPLSRDVSIPGGTFQLGASPEEPFVFDNEKWAHPVEIRPFAMARAPVTQADFAAFVEARGYLRPELWSEDGRKWQTEAQAEHPVYWKREGGKWCRRHFDQWVPLEPHLPVIHVNWFEADAYCRWAGRRLPTEAEWELAASGQPANGGFNPEKSRFPWGNEPPNPDRANLDWALMRCAEVGAFSQGDSPFGCRQMIGNVWEWTSTTFLPYPGFVPDPYKEYSEPWFQTRKVLRGGCWATRSRLLRNTWRNFFTPDRRDIWAGFRTCALTA